MGKRSVQCQICVPLKPDAVKYIQQSRTYSMDIAFVGVNIGIKDIFKCFMMVLNYRAAEYLSHEARRAECFNTADR